MSPFCKSVVVFSLLLNLLLAGIIIGNIGSYFLAMRHRHYTIAEIASELPQDKQADFEAVMQRADKETAEMRAQFFVERKKAVALLKAEPFDKAAYLAKMQASRQLRVQVLQKISEAVAEAAQPLSAQDREKLAGMLRYSPRLSNDE